MTNPRSLAACNSLNYQVKNLHFHIENNSSTGCLILLLKDIHYYLNEIEKAEGLKITLVNGDTTFTLNAIHEG